MAYAERLFSLFVLISVSMFFFISFQYEMFSSIGGVGGAFLPRIISFLLLFLVSLYVWNVFRNKSSISNREDRSAKGIVTKQLFMAIILLVCLFLIDIFGMLPTLGLFLLISLHYIEKVTWVKSALFSVLIITFLYFIFVKWLNIILPSGLFL